MSGNDAPELTTSDESLVERTRSGDQRAFAELWRRHYRSGARVARQFTSSIDADDLVSEAYTRIYQRVLAGGGPTGAFRPYLYTTIRNLASTWGAASRDVQVDDIADFEDPDTIEDPAAIALDRTLTARAFRSLPDRWQSVLWYTEVEGMDPHEVAPILGLTANGVAALSYRAREGLRKAWLQAHINDASASGECQWAISRIGEHARDGLSSRDAERMAFHLATCAKCGIISEEVDEVGSRLAFVMLPILLGGVAGGAALASFGHASAAVAASAIPALPGAIAASSSISSGALGLFGASSTPVALVGSLAIVAAIGGGVVVNLPPEENTYSASSTASDQQNDSDAGTDDSVADVSVDADVEDDDFEVHIDDDTVVPDVPITDDDVTEVVDDTVDDVTDVVDDVKDTVDTVVDGVVDTVTDDDGKIADIKLTLSGTGTPGADLFLQAAGQVYATARVDKDGKFTLKASAIPGGLDELELVQVVDEEFLEKLVGKGVVGGILGSVDDLVNDLIKPLKLSGGLIPGVEIELLD